MAHLLKRRTSGLSLKRPELMDRAKKKLASALDGLRQSHQRSELELDERVTAEHLCLAKVVRHGFPHDPQCLAFDPAQRLLAIGNGHGSVRILGDSGVDYCLKHESDSPVLHMQFLVNEGGLITACRDDMIHLWNFRQKIPEIVHSVQLQKEAISCISLPFQSRWIHVGTEKGNVFFVSVSTFAVSGYVIQWNKAIDLSSRIHPGAVRCVVACPTDPSRLLIGYEKGAFVLWNLQTKETERFPNCEQTVRAISWHHDGKQFMCGHSDGSVTVWNLRKPSECVQRLQPHGNGHCRPIDQLDWRHNNDGEQLVVFSGGMPADDGVLPALTLLRGGRSATVLEMDHPLVEFVTLPSTPWAGCPQQPYAVAALLKSDMLVIDLATPGYPCFESPHPMDLHEPAITCISYVADCSSDMIGALTLVGCKQRKQPYSERQWPITGGTGRECATGHQELLLTGHEDGSVKFWQASGEHLQLLYRLKTGRHFERQASVEGGAACAKTASGSSSISGHAVAKLKLCTESRMLLVASAAAQCTLFRFAKCDTAQEIAVIHFPALAGSSTAPAYSPTEDIAGGSGSQRELKRQAAQVRSVESHSSDTSEGEGSIGDRFVPVKVRGGAFRRPAGYQPDLVCLVPWLAVGVPERVTALCLNSAYGMLAIATTSGLALVDIVQYVLIQAWTTQELHTASEILTLGAPQPPPLVTQQSDPASQLVEAAHSAPITVPSYYHQHHYDRHHEVDRRKSTDAAHHHQQQQHSHEMTNKWKQVSRAQSFVQMIRHPKHSTARRYSNRRSISPNEDNQNPIGQLPEYGVSSGVLSPSSLKPTRSHSVKDNYIMRKISEHVKVTIPENRPSPMAAASKAFFRLNTDKQKSTDWRPSLTKAQSLAQNMETNHFSSTAGDPSPRHSMDPGSTPKKQPLNPDSRSPSVSSLERESNALEMVTSLSFINSYASKNDSVNNPCLWLGTSFGSCMALNLNLSADPAVFPITVTPSGCELRLKGELLYTVFMDESFCLLGSACESFREAAAKEAATSNNTSTDSPCGFGIDEKKMANRVLTKSSLSPSYTSAVENGNVSEEINQLLVAVAEQEVRVLALPSFAGLFCYRCEEIPLVRARASHVAGLPVLLALAANGAVLVLSLPSLRPLLNAQLFRFSIDLDDPLLNKFSLAEHGLAMYMCSPTEVEKITVCSELARQVADCSGELFLPVDMPEPPKTSFLKGVSTLFSAQQKDSIDLDNLFSDQSAGKPSRGVARIIPGPSNSLDTANSKSISAGQAANMALQALHERSEKLNATVDVTEQLKNNAMNLQQRSAKLAEKYEKKKWYQL